VKIDLLHGGWASIRDVETITNRERRQAMRAWNTAEGGDVERGIVLNDQLIALFVDEWSFDLPLPKDNIGVLEDLLGHDYDSIAHEVLEAQKNLFLNFQPTPDPASPTGPSSE
jgi:hypothetical protein